MFVEEQIRRNARYIPAALAGEKSGVAYPFDSRTEFCQAVHMFRPIRKFVAALLAIWLPLFSGSALAASVQMQMTSSDCHPAAAQPNQHALHHDAPLYHHASPHDDRVASNQSHAAGQQDQQNSSCKDCGVCHFACSGYLATAAIKATETRLSTRIYATSSTQFQSFSSAPLDPPPLALA
ncbi:MAG: hypothetical protein ACOY9D_09375 [Pseudomonadota bacterium]